MRIASPHIIFALAVILFVGLPCLWDKPPALVEALELKSLDLRFKIRGGGKPADRL